MKIYLAGPMSGIPQFNFPAFTAAAAALRKADFDVVSPAEMDAEIGIDKEALASTDGDNTKLTQTWGDLLARDVKLIADSDIAGIVFLPNWWLSRGARLEATIGILKSRSFQFFRFQNGGAEEMSRERVLALVHHTESQA